MREFNEEETMSFGKLVASLFGHLDQGDEMIVKLGAENGLTPEEAREVFSVDEASVSFTMKDDGKDYTISLGLAKTEEEKALEGMPAGTEHLGGGLYAVPDALEDEL